MIALLSSVSCAEEKRDQESRAETSREELADLAATANKTVVILSLQQLRNIRVLVRKREEDPFDIPASLTIITEQEIDQLGVNNYLQLERYIPNVDAGIIRGIPSFSGSIAQDAGNSVYVDGVYIRGAASIYDLVDLNRVEVIRGPQAILFGRNTMTGAINYVTNKPEATTTNRWRLKLGNDDIVQFSGASNIAFSDTFYSRLSLSLDQRQGYYHNQVDGKDLNNSDRIYGRLQMRWLASDKISTNLSLDKARSASQNIQGILRQPSSAEAQAALDYWSAVAGLTPDQTLTSSYSVHQDSYRDPLLREFWNGIFAFEYRLDAMHEFTYTGARRGESSSLNTDDDDRLPVLLISSPDQEKSFTTSHEFRFNG
ncbi:MAG: TonB-dependent receptor plug domain-containing protein, partial [Pseudomonadales bacterium]|nr:TonB-dependent receptor plug domain-containing protein [Pseudomonadales bacterium]